MDVIFTGAYIRQEKHQLLEIHERENNLMTASPLLNFPQETLDPIDDQGNFHGSDHIVSFKEASRSGQKERPGFFSSLFGCGKKQQVQERIYEPFVPNSRVNLLPMSVCPGHVIKHYLGIVDVYLIRLMRMVGIQESQGAQIIEDFIKEAKEILKSKVEALGGNFLVGLKIDIN